MKKFYVLVEETLARNIEVYAKNEDDAIGKISQQYKEQKIILDSEDFSNVEIGENLFA